MKTTVTKADVYTRVTDRIIASLESGVRPWMKPWTTPSDDRSGVLPLRHTGEPYRGINVLLLWGDAMEKGFTRNVWMTFKQAEAYGARVRKGEHGSLVVYADRATKTETNERGEETEREFAFMTAYTVFNVEQIEGLGSRFAPAPKPEEGPTVDLIAQAETFFAGTAATFRHGGHRAFYAPGPDVIQLPESGVFRDAESYAATKAHELIHWTGHKTRMAREFGKRFGDRAYAFEELVAEMGAAFLCADLAISPETRDDHPAYLAHWLGVLREDKRAIFSAAAHAQRAADFLHGLQAKGEEGEKLAA